MSERPTRLVVSLVQTDEGVRGTVVNETDDDELQGTFEGWLELLVLIGGALGGSD